MSTRRRKRSDEDEDELSSPNRPIDTSPLSTTKKRKLNTRGIEKSSPKNTTAGASGGVLGKLGSLLGYGKENGSGSPAVDEEETIEVEDSVGEDEEGDTVDVEVPVTQDSEARRSRQRREIIQEDGALEGDQTDDELATGRDDIWDIEESDPEDGRSNVTAQGTPNKTPQSASQSDGIKRNKDGSIQKKRGRPKKNPDAETIPRQSIPKPKASVRSGSFDPKQQWAMLKKAKELSMAAVRDQLIASGQVEEAEEYTKECTTILEEVDVEQVEVEDLAPPPAPAVTPRKRGRPRKSEAFRSGFTPKGILTPSRGGVLKSKKSVTFGSREDLDLGFRDIPDSATQSTAIEIPEDENSDESDEITCAICSGAESEKPNEIIFCDNCDLSVHQACYNVPVIPEGDWLCRDCSAEALPQLEVKEVETTEVPSDLPDIEGFETHLRSIQRVVLDKLTGQRPIKLRGYNEERQKVYQVIEQTVLAGEGNSMLVMGARGTGKTTVSAPFLSNVKLQLTCPSWLNQSSLSYLLTKEKTFM